MINLNELPRYDIDDDGEQVYIDRVDDGDYLKVDDVEALIKKIILRLEMMEAHQKNSGHGETRMYYPEEPIKKLIAELKAPKGTTPIKSIGPVD